MEFVRPQNPESGHGESSIEFARVVMGKSVTIWQTSLGDHSPWDCVQLVRDELSDSFVHRLAFITRTDGEWMVTISFDVSEPTSVPDGSRWKFRKLENGQATISLREVAISPLTTVDTPGGLEVLSPGRMPLGEAGPIMASLGVGHPPGPLLDLCKPAGLNRASKDVGYVVGRAVEWKQPGWIYSLEPSRPKRSYQDDVSDAQFAKTLVETYTELGRGNWAEEFCRRIEVDQGTHQVVVDRLVKNGLLQHGGQPYRYTFKTRRLLAFSELRSD